MKVFFKRYYNAKAFEPGEPYGLITYAFNNGIINKIDAPVYSPKQLFVESQMKRLLIKFCPELKNKKIVLIASKYQETELSPVVDLFEYEDEKHKANI